jgi:hypothetical protein
VCRGLLDNSFHLSYNIALQARWLHPAGWLVPGSETWKEKGQ